MTAPARRRRMTKEERREQLLDAAETLLLSQGSAAVTMERLAEYAGVSKALPYAHFENSDEVLVAMYQRVVFALGGRILECLTDAPPEREERAALVVRTYFETVREFGPILGAVTAPGSRTAELGDAGGSLGRDFVSSLLADSFDVPPPRAASVAPVVFGALTGAITSWATGASSRRDAEDLAVRILLLALA